MSPILLWIIFVVIAYLCGAISFACAFGRAKGINLREHGSGNLGATNVGRVLGKKYGIACFLLDTAKGLVPTLGYGMVAGLICHTCEPDPAGQADTYSALAMLGWLTVGAAAILGHMYSVFLMGKGGKGVATSLGVLLGVFPVLTIAALVGLVVWLIVLRVWSYVSLASMVAACSLPIVAGIAACAMGLPWDASAVLILTTAALAALVIFKHRSNIARLREGTETKVNWLRRKSNDTQ